MVFTEGTGGDAFAVVCEDPRLSVALQTGRCILIAEDIPVVINAGNDIVRRDERGLRLENAFDAAAARTVVEQTARDAEQTVVS